MLVYNIPYLKSQVSFINEKIALRIAYLIFAEFVSPKKF